MVMHLTSAVRVKLLVGVRLFCLGRMGQQFEVPFWVKEMGVFAPGPESAALLLTLDYSHC